MKIYLSFFKHINIFLHFHTDSNLYPNMKKAIEIYLLHEYGLLFIFKFWKIISEFKILLITENLTVLETSKIMCWNTNFSYILIEQYSSGTKMYLEKLYKLKLPCKLNHNFIHDLKNWLNIMILVLPDIILVLLFLKYILLNKITAVFGSLYCIPSMLTYFYFAKLFLKIHCEYFIKYIDKNTSFSISYILNNSSVNITLKIYYMS